MDERVLADIMAQALREDDHAALARSPEMTLHALGREWRQSLRLAVEFPLICTPIASPSNR